MPAPDLIAGFYSSSGTLAGVQVLGVIAIPFSLASGIALQDASANWWVLTIGTDGRLSTQQVTF